MNNGITELAKLLRERENREDYSPMFGKITSLPNLQIQIGGKIVIDASLVKSLFDIYETDTYGKYIYLGKEVVLLPYADYQKFIAVGVVV